MSAYDAANLTVSRGGTSVVICYKMLIYATRKQCP